MVARTAADYAGLRDSLARAGTKIVRELPEIKTFVIKASTTDRQRHGADARVLGIVPDHIATINSDDRHPANLKAPGLRSARKVNLPAVARTVTAAAGINPDPAFDYKGLQWDFRRIGLPQGWQTTAGRPAVTVGVADTGLDFTHADLRPNIRRVVDFTATEDPPLCKTFFGDVRPASSPAEFGGPVTTDWNGHGSWIGGNIAAALNGTGINGIAPKVGLVALKISSGAAPPTTRRSWPPSSPRPTTGSTSSASPSAGTWTARDPEQNLIYQLYVDTVAYARAQGTTIVASAGNEHVRVGAGGRVLSHGVADHAGRRRWSTCSACTRRPVACPGRRRLGDGQRGERVVRRRARRGRRARPPTPTRPASRRATATRRPASAGPTSWRTTATTARGSTSRRRAARGSSTCPFWDRGGTPGFPYTDADLTNVWQDFSTTSNWAVEIPCFTFGAGSGFPPGPVLLDDPGHVDGRAARVGRARAHRERARRTCGTPGRAGHPGQGPGRRPGQPHPGALRDRHVARRPDRAAPARPATATSGGRPSRTATPTEQASLNVAHP